MTKLFHHISLLMAVITGVLPSTIGAQVVINEISICNVSKELDASYDYSGWIELYNATNQDINLRDLYFSDEQGNPMKYRLSSSRTLTAHGYEVVWLNGEVVNQTTLYTLDTDADEGGWLYVASKKGVVYDSLHYEQQYTNVSYGRLSNGNPASACGYFLTSTFRGPNDSTQVASEVVATPVLSLSSGFYNTPITVTLYCSTPEATVHYTMDASDPTPASPLYVAPLSFDTSVVLRVKAFKEGCLDGGIASATYLLNSRRPNLPTVFIMSDTLNLFNDSLGIYCIGTNGIIMTSGKPKANYNRRWTRLCAIDLLDTRRIAHQPERRYFHQWQCFAHFRPKVFQGESPDQIWQETFRLRYLSYEEGIALQNLFAQ